MGKPLGFPIAGKSTDWVAVAVAPPALQELGYAAGSHEGGAPSRSEPRAAPAPRRGEEGGKERPAGSGGRGLLDAGGDAPVAGGGLQLAGGTEDGGVDEAEEGEEGEGDSWLAFPWGVRLQT